MFVVNLETFSQWDLDKKELQQNHWTSSEQKQMEINILFPDSQRKREKDLPEEFCRECGVLGGCSVWPENLKYSYRFIVKPVIQHSSPLHVIEDRSLTVVNTTRVDYKSNWTQYLPLSKSYTIISLKALQNFFVPNIHLFSFLFAGFNTFSEIEVFVQKLTST